MADSITASATISRRNVLRGAAALAAPAVAGGLAGCVSGSEAGSGQLSLSLGWLPDVTAAGLWYALEKGYLKDDGISLSWEPGGPNTPASVERVAGDAAQVGIQSNMQAFFDAVLQNADLVMFGSTYQTNPAGLLSLADQPVRRPEDLLGKRVLGPSPVDAESITAILRINNLPDDDFEFIPAGSTPDALLEGQGDVQVIVLTNQPITLQMEYGMEPERDYVALSYDAFNIPRYSSVLFGQRDYIRRQHDQMVGLVRALQRGWKDNIADVQASGKDDNHAAHLVTEEYGSDLGLDVRQQSRQNAAQLPFLTGTDSREHGLFWVDTDRLGGPMYEALRAAGRTNLPKVSDVLDLSILEDAAT